jgi:mono/diheme cytochrome c family protein
MPHLSELHGAATHLAVIAIPLFAILHFARRAGRGGAGVIAAEPWALGAAVVGMAAAGVTGLLVWGQAQTTLRGQSFRVGTAHFWLGIAVGVLSVAAAADWWRSRVAHGERHRPVLVPAIAVLIVVGVLVQGYLGGRMTYNDAVGIADGGQLAQTARGTAALETALARGVNPAVAGRQAFSAQGLGCARCHGDQAQGQRGPRLAGGVELEEFRGVHGHLLFPAKIVSDRDFAAVNAWLQTLGGGRGGGGDGDGDAG